MCGRYTLDVTTPDDLAPLFGHLTGAATLTPRFNIAPTQRVPIVRRLADDSRELADARWGLIPHWADPSSFSATLFNARSETAGEKPSFRDAMKTGRCLVPSTGFYEWKAAEGGKTPHFIHREDGAAFAFAGLYSVNAKGDTPVLSCTILTTRPNRLMRELHARMPVMLEPPMFAEWLDPSVRDPAMLVELLEPREWEGFEAYPVSTRVNRPSEDGPELTESASA